MIRGINKQIIEIRCTNNEYFEKILLFVKGEKADSPSALLHEQALSYCTPFVAQNKIKKRGRINKAALTAVIISMLVSFGVIVAAVLFL